MPDISYSVHPPIGQDNKDWQALLKINDYLLDKERMGLLECVTTGLSAHFHSGGTCKVKFTVHAATYFEVVLPELIRMTPYPPFRRCVEVVRICPREVITGADALDRPIRVAADEVLHVRFEATTEGGRGYNV